MKIFFFCITLLLTMANKNFDLKSKESPFIRVQYIGEIDKPITSIVFFDSKYSGGINEINDTFHISPTTFSNLAKMISQQNKIFIKTPGHFYRVDVVSETLNTSYYIKTKSDLKIAFKEMLSKFTSSSIKERLNSSMQQIIQRLDKI